MRINLDEGEEEEEMSHNSAIKMEDLRAVKVVGKGAMGTVFLVQKEGFNKPLALKAMSKSVLEKQTDGLKRLNIERKILRRLRHPFLPALVGHVETEKIVGWVMDYCPGGDLNALRRSQSEKTFSESILRFYAAEIVLALEHLHSLGIVYRDLKPENVLIQANGHIMLTDFDLSARLHLLPASASTAATKRHSPPHKRQDQDTSRRRGPFSLMTCACMRPLDSNAARVSPVTKKAGGGGGGGAARTNSFVGTEEYVAPEMLKGEGHDFAVDWWALGILLYEMVYGKSPFRGSTRKESFYNILVHQPKFMGPWTPLRDLIVRLLSKEPQKRLGSCKGAEEIKTHLFFRGLDWEAVKNVSRAPFVPPPVSVEEMTSMEALDVEECLEKQPESKDKTHSEGSQRQNLGVRTPDKEETNVFSAF